MSIILDLDEDRELVPDDRYCPQCEKSFGVPMQVCPDDGTRLVSLAPRPDPLIGRTIDDRYTIVERLAVGGMGAVYRAKQHSVDREVALKVVRPGLVADADTIKRFLREAKLASQLAHPNSVGVLDFGETSEGMFYLVMELLAGRTLDEILRQEGVFDAKRLVRVGIQICDALGAAHALSIIHRDLKPSNILMLDNSRDLVKVLDFGLAKSLEGDASMTRSGAMCGTPAYLAPERACGRPGDHRSDLYALGCVLYLLGSGRLPFVSDSIPVLLRMQVCEPAPPMTGVPAALAEIIDRLLAKDPDQRFQTADALRDALEETLPVTGQVTIFPRARRKPSVHGPETIASLPVADGVALLPTRLDTAPPVVAPPPPRRRRQAWWLAGAIIMVAAGASLGPDASRARAAEPPVIPVLAPRVGDPILLEARIDEPAAERRAEPPRTRAPSPHRPRTPRGPRLPF